MNGELLTQDLVKLLILENFLFRKNILEEREDNPERLQKETEEENSEDIEEQREKEKEEQVEAEYSIEKTKPSSPVYYVSFDGYTKRLEMQRQDFTRNVPSKNLRWHPRSVLGGVLGYTYLGAGTINKRSDLVFNPNLSYEVDVHESIHTEWEYETRVLTRWILSYDSDFKKY